MKLLAETAVSYMNPALNHQLWHSAIVAKERLDKL